MSTVVSRTKSLAPFKLFAPNPKIRAVWISEVSAVVHVSGTYSAGRAPLYTHRIAVSDVAPLVIRRGTTRRLIQPLFTGIFNAWWLRFSLILVHGLVRERSFQRSGILFHR